MMKKFTVTVNMNIDMDVSCPCITSYPAKSESAWVWDLYLGGQPGGILFIINKQSGGTLLVNNDSKYEHALHRHICPCHITLCPYQVLCAWDLYIWVDWLGGVLFSFISKQLCGTSLSTSWHRYVLQHILPNKCMSIRCILEPSKLTCVKITVSEHVSQL